MPLWLTSRLHSFHCPCSTDKKVCVDKIAFAVGISCAFRGFLLSENRTDDGQLANPFSCASLISFPVYRGVALSVAANEAESVK